MKITVKMWMVILSCILVALPAFAEAQPEAIDEFCRTNALALAEEMETMAASDALIEMFTTDADIIEQIHDFVAAGLSQPTGYRYFEFDRSVLLNGIAQQGNSALPALSKEENALLMKRLSGPQLFSMVQAQAGGTMLEACGIISASHSYIAPDGWTGDKLLVLTREDAKWAIGVSFTETGEGILTASAAYLPARLNSVSVTDFLSQMLEGQQ